MKAQITKGFKFAIDGIRVVTVNAGDVVEGRCAEVAIAEKWGTEVAAGVPQTFAETVEPKAVEPVTTASIPRAPKNKAK